MTYNVIMKNDEKLPVCYKRRASNKRRAHEEDPPLYAFSFNTYLHTSFFDRYYKS